VRTSPAVRATAPSSFVSSDPLDAHFMMLTRVGRIVAQTNQKVAGSENEN
jgi:hypothetical protein